MPMIDLSPIEQQFDQMRDLLIRWSNINSHFQNQKGCQQLLQEIEHAFQSLFPDEMHPIHFDQSKGLYLNKRKNAPFKIYCGGHLDTVFPLNHPFQHATLLDSNRLNGPGVADMKGGLMVMLKALEFFEKNAPPHIGWEIFVNADEEVGSPESTPFIESCAQRCHIALLFEPTFEDGTYISERMGSCNYTLISHGKKGHAGRDFAVGKNAIFPLAHAISKMAQFNRPKEGILLNVGLIKGGEARNIIPDYAMCEINLRGDSLDKMVEIEGKMIALWEEYRLEWRRTSNRPPKKLTSETEHLFQILKECGDQLELKLQWRPSAGVCDGNCIASLGIPTLDSLGVRGGHLHTEQEYLDLASLCEKTKLMALFFHEIAKQREP